eukprot:5639325-Prymnesium_polylepis.1
MRLLVRRVYGVVWLGVCEGRWRCVLSAGCVGGSGCGCGVAVCGAPRPSASGTHAWMNTAPHGLRVGICTHFPLKV